MAGQGTVEDMWLWIIIGVVVVLLVIWVVATYNKLVKANVAVDEAFAQIEVQLKRRTDLIPNLVNTVKGYAAHESSTFEKVTEARAVAEHANGVAEVAAADGMLTQALRGLLAVAEAYPDLKASANFLALQEELSATENKIAFARQYYNDSVRKLNELIVAIPTKFFAGMAKVGKREFYEVPDAADRNAPTVTF